MTELDLGCLFDGIHGFGLGMSTIGARARWTVEFADYPRKVLELRVPHAEHLVDVRDVVNPPKVAGLTGGFPCQDLSLAGLGKGIGGSRSGLWTEFARIIGEVEPDVVIIENVPALLHRGMELVVANLVELGYAVEWDCLPAAAFGAPHLRDRVWIVAHKLGAPSIYGQPATLFPVPPSRAAELVGGDDDDETPQEPGWLRWPRAGWVDGDPALVMPLEPLAPRAAVRSGHVRLWPTPRAGSARSSARALRSSADNGRRSGGGQSSAPSLEQAVELSYGIIPRELAGVPLDELPPATRQLWPTPVQSDARGTRNATAQRPGGNGQHHAGVTLLDALILNGDAPMPETGLWPTPTRSDGKGGPGSNGREGGDNLRTAVAPGSLNPRWVEWLMGFPLGWTDLERSREELVAATWAREPDDLPRVAPNVANRAARLAALGNALVPAAPAWVASRYLEAST